MQTYLYGRPPKTQGCQIDQQIQNWFKDQFSFVTKADCRGNFTIFHHRMSTIQPAWEGCTTSE